MLGSKPEANTQRLSETVILPQVPVRFHTKRTAVFVSKPTRDGGNVDATFDANSRKQMTQVMMSQMRNARFLASRIHCLLAIAHPHN